MFRVLRLLGARLLRARAMSPGLHMDICIFQNLTTYLNSPISSFPFSICLRLLRHPRRDLSPEPASGPSTALPGISVDQSKIVRDARVQTQVIRVVGRDEDAFHCSARRVEVHLKTRPVRVRGPVQVVATASRHGCVCSVPAGYDGRNDRTVVHDEVAPNFLESVNQIRRWCRCVD